MKTTLIITPLIHCNTYEFLGLRTDDVYAIIICKEANLLMFPNFNESDQIKVQVTTAATKNSIKTIIKYSGIGYSFTGLSTANLRKFKSFRRANHIHNEPAVFCNYDFGRFILDSLLNAGLPVTKPVYIQFTHLQ